MPTNLPTILAIDPGTKELGFAVLKDSHLEYYGVKTFKRRSPPHALLADIAGFIAALIVRYRPESLAIERTLLIQQSAALLTVATEEIKFTAKHHRLTVNEYAPTNVRAVICQKNKATKRDAVQVIANRFPELARFLRNQTQWEALYWAHMFDAVAVGLMCLHTIDDQHNESQSQGLRAA
jgi:Holliday junction resolvasome RuvABC endonuclease subunit